MQVDRRKQVDGINHDQTSQAQPDPMTESASISKKRARHTTLLAVAFVLMLIGGSVIDPQAGFACFLLAGILAFVPALRGSGGSRSLAVVLAVIAIALAISTFPEAKRHHNTYPAGPVTKEKEYQDDRLQITPYETPVNKLDLALPTPFQLSYLIAYRQFHLNQPLLIQGFHPLDDRVRQASQRLGKKSTAQDWILEEGDAAIWVTGIPAPSHQEQIIVGGRLEEKNGALSLQGYQLIHIGDAGKQNNVLQKDAYLYYYLPGSKSNSCPVELSGLSVAIVYYDAMNSVIVQAVEPGVSRLKIYSQWWRDAQPEFQAEYEIVVVQ